jgi:hypothetical protein
MCISRSIEVIASRKVYREADVLAAWSRPEQLGQACRRMAKISMGGVRQVLDRMTTYG